MKLTERQILLLYAILNYALNETFETEDDKIFSVSITVRGTAITPFTAEEVMELKFV